MIIVLTGKNGQLGWELERSLSTLGEVVSVDYPEVDLSDIPAAREFIYSVRPNIIVNAAAYTAVDKAEKEKELAWAVNAEAPGMLAETARKLNAGFIHYSTDYVFDGTSEHPYNEDDRPNPINEYGRSKLGGEAAVREIGGAYLVLRTSWVFSNRTGGFVSKVLQWARNQRVVSVVTDQISSPTWCRSLAEATAQVIAMGRDDPVGFLSEKCGLYHLAGSGSASRYEWANKILELDPDRSEQIVEELRPARTADFPTPAARPLYSVLDCNLFSRTFGLTLPDWKLQLRLALA